VGDGVDAAVGDGVDVDEVEDEDEDEEVFDVVDDDCWVCDELELLVGIFTVNASVTVPFD
jgi:hypothetical protein